MTKASSLFFALLIGCGTPHKETSGIPYQAYDESFSSVVDRAVVVFQKRFGAIQVPSMVIELNAHEMEEACDIHGLILHGCLVGDVIYLADMNNDTFMCNKLVHELGHLYYQRTEGDADVEHKNHHDFFTWTISACG